MTWPTNVRGLDGTRPPMACPPSVRTLIGYHRWCHTLCDTESEDYGYPGGVDYFVLPDGSAEIVRWSIDILYGRHVDPSWEVDGDTAVERIPAGEWEVVYPKTNFGSRGGEWIRRLAPSN